MQQKYKLSIGWLFAKEYLKYLKLSIFHPLRYSQMLGELLPNVYEKNCRYVQFLNLYIFKIRNSSWKQSVRQQRPFTSLRY